MIYTESAKKFLEDLMNTPSPSGYEGPAIKKVDEYIKDSTTLIFKDRQGNRLYKVKTVKGNPKINVLLTAHIDEIGYQIQTIEDTGLMHFIPIGGIDSKVVPGQNIEIYTRQGKKIKAVIGKKAIHTEEPGERETACKLDSLLIDVGCTNPKEVRELGIKVGDIAVPAPNANTEFGNNCVCGRGLDDKAGISVITELARHINRFQGERVNANVYIAILTQEEVGLRGATRFSNRMEELAEVKFDIALDLDVTFCTDEGRGVSEAKFGKVKLGSGPVLFMGPDCSPGVVDKLRLTGDFQLACHRPGGTNTTALQDYLVNSYTAHLGIPLRNMHTPVEICSWNDLEEAVINLSLFLSQDLEDLC